MKRQKRKPGPERAAQAVGGRAAKGPVTVRHGEYGLEGVSAAARAVGRSPSWVSLVLNGKRRSRRLMTRLRAAGVRLFPTTNSNKGEIIA